MRSELPVRIDRLQILFAGFNFLDAKRRKWIPADARKFGR